MDQYMEYLVKKQTTGKDKGIRIVFIAIIVLTIALAIFFLNPVILIVTVILYFIYRYYVYPHTDLEYEYLYVDKTLSVDKIMAQESRKTVATYELERIELIAPENSDKLADYKGRDMQVTEYWSMDRSDGHVPYVLILDGGRQKVLMDLPEEFVKLIQSNAPRKVFLQ